MKITRIEAIRNELQSGERQTDVRSEAVERLTRNRYEQQEDFYRIQMIEKWLTALLLVFILIIASFNIISSLSMLILDKKDDIRLLHTLGADERMKEDRSRMNICFVLKPGYEELQDDFFKFATERGMVGIKGHRLVGGFRASCYNAMDLEGVQALVDCIKEYESLH